VVQLLPTVPPLILLSLLGGIEQAAGLGPLAWHPRYAPAIVFSSRRGSMTELKKAPFSHNP
jgi:hypothetical protein